MSIYTEKRESDPRVMSGILATAALERLDKGQKEDRIKRAYLDSLLWLLDMYRYDAFSAPEPQGVLQQTPLSEPAFQPPESGLQRVKTALVTAHKAAYSDFSKDAVVEELKRVFQFVMEDRGHDADNDQSIKKARTFFSAFIEALGLNA